MKKANFTSVAGLWSWVVMLAMVLGVSTANAQNCTLSCNNLVQISLDEDCDVELLADVIAEGDLNITCPNGNFQVQVKRGNLWLPTVGNAHVTVDDINKTLQVRLRDLNSGNSCWGYIHVEDKLAPQLDCADITIACAVNNFDPRFFRTPDNPATQACEGLGLPDAFPNQLAFPSGEVTYQGNNIFLVTGSQAALMENCTAVTLSYADTWFDLPCNTGAGGLPDVSAYIRRVWSAVDASGNIGQCTQFIYLERKHVFDVLFPIDVTVACGENPATTPATTGAPYIDFGGCIFPLYPTTTQCEMNVTYTDQVIPVCDGTYKILRTWVVYDWCLPTQPFPPYQNPIYYIQLIKVVDDEGPEILTPGFCGQTYDVNVNVFDCESDWNLPDITVTDNCSRLKSVRAEWQIDGVTYFTNGNFANFPGNNYWDRDTLAVLGVANNLPLGNTTITYIITDDCGNSTTCTIRARVQDQIPPEAVCTEYLQVSLGASGMALVNASSFNQGSYDNCSDVYFKARRMNANDCQVVNRFHDQVKFCCDDIGDTIQVILRVYDVTVQPGEVGLTYQEDNSNDCMVKVYVDDKLKPVCTSPANVTVSCEAFDPSLWAYGSATAVDNCCIDTIIETRNYSLFDTLCNRGTITRTFRAVDCGGLTSLCTQRVFVNYNQDYHIRFPNDRVVFECDGTTAFGEPVINKKDCELIAISYVDQIFTVVPDACYKIERLWTITNWCTYDPNQPCIYVDNPNPNSLPNASANLQGPTVSPNGTPAPWNPSSVALVPGGPVKNFADYWQANANCYQYKQIIKVIDNEKPVIDSWELDDCDLTANDPLFWNGMNWWDPIHQTHDLCEAPVRISLTGLDSCSGSNVDIRALIFLDLNGDNIMETVLNTNNSNFTPTVPNGFIWYNNYQNPNYGVNGPNGQLLEFDHRPVLPQLKYRFAVRDQVIGGKRKLSVMWTDRANPNPNNNGDWVLPQIPLGKHKVKWFVEDNCGNETVWESPWNLRDCKAPTVVCFNGLSVNIMPTGMITIWGSDFLQYGEDNCTPADQLVYSIRKSGTGTGFPVDANGNPIPGVTFTCAELGTQYVELWAKDKAGNASYCETYVIVQDPGGVNCAPGTKAAVAGDLKVDFNDPNSGVADVQVQLNGSNPNPGQPDINMFVNSNNQGSFNFNAIPIGGNYTVTPAKDNDPLNGVSTYDLLLISKHILGVEPLNTPYKMIAADANKSGSITSYDILELRKLILGLYTELPNNTSWRFVDRNQTLDATNPFASTINEVTQIQNLAANQAANFYAVKVGDVNNNAVANNIQSADDRTAGTVFFDVEDRAVKAGEEVVVNFKSADKTAGFQFTMNLNGLEATEIMGGNVKAENFAVFAADKALTASVDGNANEFAVKFRATKDGDLSKMIGVSSRITRAEAYTANGDRHEVAFRFNGTNGSIVAGAGFELLQNTPNPVANTTAITFNLPEATNATLTITNAEGRIIKTMNADFAKGMNTVNINRADLESGILFYQLDTPTNSAVKKMIVVD